MISQEVSPKAFSSTRRCHRKCGRGLDEGRGAFVIEAAVAGVDPKQFDVQVTPTELVLRAQVHHSDREREGEVVLCEFANGPTVAVQAA